MSVVNQIEPLILDIPDPFGRSVNYRLKFLYMESSKGSTFSFWYVSSPFGLKTPTMGPAIDYPHRVAVDLMNSLKYSIKTWGNWRTGKGWRLWWISIASGLRKLSLFYTGTWSNDEGLVCRESVFGATNSKTKAPLIYWSTTYSSFLFWGSGGVYLRRQDIESILKYMGDKFE